MPKSKRNKQVELSKSRKKGLEGRKQLYNEIRSSVDTYTHLFIFSVNDMRNSKMKSVRHQWKHSRFFIGKNKVMAIALGRTPEEEYRPNLHKIGENLKGQKGLLFTNQTVEDVLSWFRSYSEGDFARSGNIATEDVSLSEGPLIQFPHNLESYLRQLGLPTTLKKGVVHLLKDHVVCKAGDVLSPETARILKLLEYQMAEFHIKIECVWSQDGSFLDLKSDSKENVEGDSSQSSIKEMFEISKEPANLESIDEMEVAESDDDEDVKDNDEDNLNFKQPSKDDGNTHKKDSTENVEPSSTDSEDEQIPTLIEISNPVNKDNDKEAENILDRDTVLKMTKEKMKEVETPPPKYSPKMTRGRAAASAKKKVKTPEEYRHQKSADSEDEQIPTPVEISNPVNKDSDKETENIPDRDTVLKMTKQKVEEVETPPPKYSPKMTRARATASAKKKVKTPEEKEKAIALKKARRSRVVK